MQANRRLNLLVREGFLEIIEKGGTKENPRKATRFKYVVPSDALLRENEGKIAK